MDILPGFLSQRAQRLNPQMSGSPQCWIGWFCVILPDTDTDTDTGACRTIERILYLKTGAAGFCDRLAVSLSDPGGDLVSTWVTSPEVHAEVQGSS